MADNTFICAGSAALFAMTLTSLPAIAATERQLDSHDHGHAQVNMAVSGQEVLAELITPAANVIGFEYMPKSDEDKMAVTDATAQLSRGEQLFVFNSAAECSLLTAEVESALLADDRGDEHHDGEGHDDHHDDEKHDDHDDEHHDSEGHDEHHDDEKHDGHNDEHHDGEGHDDHHDDEKHDDHDHEGHDDGHESHSEFHVTWAFTCANPDELSSVSVKLFEAFSGFEEIDMSVAGEDAQASFELSPDQFEVEL